MVDERLANQAMWRVVDGELVAAEPEEPPEPPLEEAKAEAMLAVDREAEQTRLLFITPGAGQAMEYKATEDEARRFVAQGGNPQDYPFLMAEVEAQGHGATLAAVAAQVIAEADAWRAVGSEIKRLRRAAKIAIEAATTAAEARAAASVAWPAPPG